MEEPIIIKTKSVSIREVFQNEERDFTPWLEENLDLLKMGLKPYERESIVYDRLRIDLLVESLEMGKVAIENQYNTSDNEHLGKIQVYLSGSKTKTGIWVAEEFKEQHKEVVLKLNKSGAYNIYLVQVSAKKIVGEPEITGHIIDFDVIIAPDIELREIGTGGIRIRTERELLYKKFWQRLLEITNTKTKLFSGRKGTIGNYLGAPTNISNVRYIYSITKNTIRIELYIDTQYQLTNKSIFDNIMNHKDEIEERFGAELNWDRLDDKRASRVRDIIIDRDWTDESKWNELHEEMSDKMVMFESAIKDYIKE